MTPSTAAAFVLIAFGGLIAFMNGLVLLQSYRGTRHRSTIGIVGAALLGFGMRMLPATHNLFWLAIVLDPGTLLIIVRGLPLLAGGFRPGRSRKQRS